MKIQLQLLFIALIISGTSNLITGQSFAFDNNWGPDGMSIEWQDQSGVRMNFSVSGFTMEDILVNEEMMKQLLLPGHFMHQETGAPDLPGKSYFLAMPTGAVPRLYITAFRSDTIEGIEIVPAPVIPIDNSNEPLVYLKNQQIYQEDAFYPPSPAVLFETTLIRGIDVAVVGCTPFLYNPVQKQLIVFYDLKISVEFEGGNGNFGDERYRSRFWDPIITDLMINRESLPAVDYTRSHGHGNRDLSGCEYLIISPDGADFQQWADSIKNFRTEQGILTQVVTITDVGGNTAASIETYINNAYNNWDIPPDACLLLGDYGTDPQSSIISQVLNDHPGGYNPYVSDNLFADVSGDLLPEIAFARITARNAAELSIMVTKFLDYERNPPVSADFYDHPITALGWQTERWFQICSESVGGFLKNELSKNPVRINEIYEGNPSVDPWSTATNTTTVVNYFGPSGQGYIPSSPTTLGGWAGGTATAINNAINSGAFLLQHRDHGYTQGWGEPAYSTNNVSALTNSDLTFVLSINCQTGKFDATSECLAEKFHRHSYNGQGSGALGVIAPTEVSYSFVNDAYTWGIYDHLWPEFMPDYSTNPASRGLLPCFGNAAGKYHLQQSTWPPLSNTYKNITYKLFHYHGDAFSTLYSEIPQPLTVVHDAVIPAGNYVFDVAANEGSFIALTIDGEIIGTALGTGSSISVNISGQQMPGQVMVVTVTKQNHLRYRSLVNVIPADGPCVLLHNSPVINDSAGNINGVFDYGETVWLSLPLKNLGSDTAFYVQASISTDDPWLTLIDPVQSYGTIAPDEIITVPDGFQVAVGTTVPDQHLLSFVVSVTDGTGNWTSSFELTAHAPVFQLARVIIEETSGNGNRIFDPGETASFTLYLINQGSSTANDVTGVFSTSEPLLAIPVPELGYGNLNPGDTVTRKFYVEADPLQPAQEWVRFHFLAYDDPGATMLDSIDIMLGKIPALILDIDPNHSSGPAMQNAITAHGLDVDYVTAFPEDIEIYQSVFVCLGIYSTNHVLTSAEGQVLAEYLDAGGKLYMEGGDTWAWDQATPVHPMFNISGLSDGTGNLAGISGAAGTYAEGLTFTYGGANNYMDQLGAIAPAFVTFSNTNPVYHTGISYDAGTYKTIGASHEFGGLNNGTFTRVGLMRSYLGFFGIPVFSDWLGLTADWHAPANWSNGLVPDENTIVRVQSGGIQPTQFSGGAAVCTCILLGPGVQLTIPSAATLVIQKEQ